MNIGERILLYLSRSPKENDYSEEESELTIANALDVLTAVYPHFDTLVAGKRVVDFGCGVGFQSIALVKKHNCSVIGVDTNLRTLNKAMENAIAYNVPSQQLSFTDCISPELNNSFDVVISQNSFEHFRKPENVLDEMGRLIKASGIILLTFGPPWLAPYGSHMRFFCKLPWMNVLFSEEAVMNVRSSFRSDGAKRYEDVESGLNKMTIAKFESMVSSCGLVVTYRKYECVKGINWFSQVPILREFLINHVTVILCKPTFHCSSINQHG